MPLRPPAGFISAFYDPLRVADAPTIGTATGGNAQASVTFTAPSNVGGSAITAYYAVSNPGQITSSAASSPVTVTGLTNGTSYTFTVWALNSFGPSAYSAATGSVSPAGPRGLLFGGYSSSTGNKNIISYITIQSAGNATSFGNISSGSGYFIASCASSTRALIAGNGDRSSSIQYVTISSLGNTSAFGLLSNSVGAALSCSSSTRGIFAGGFIAGNIPIGNIDYVTIANAGNATSFGSLTLTTAYGASCSSPTRGLFAGGVTSGSQKINTISYITIASTGNATYFGDLNSFASGSGQTSDLGACSSNTRAIFGGGNESGGGAGVNNYLQYVTIASTGSGSYFGNLTVKRQFLSGTSDSLRGVFGSAVNENNQETNVIDYITIASTGNATRFGDLAYVVSYGPAMASNAHGGL